MMDYFVAKGGANLLRVGLCLHNFRCVLRVFLCVLREPSDCRVKGFTKNTKDTTEVQMKEIKALYSETCEVLKTSQVYRSVSTRFSSISFNVMPPLSLEIYAASTQAMV